jgi:opacity protein-like surface antigen
MKALLLVGLLAQAQPPPAPVPQLPRADAHFVIGWQNIRKDQPQNHYNDWLNDIFYGGAGAGFYWTDNLKTQVDFGAGTRAKQYRYRQVPANGGIAYESSRLTLRQQAVSIGQQYQFFRNQWFHPHLGVGVELARETTTEEYEPITFFDNVTRTSRVIQPARTEGPEHDFIARAFAEGGMKAYITRRAFFTGDMRMMFRHGIDEVLFRAGFGFDF